MFCPIMSGRQAFTSTSGAAGEKPKVMMQPINIKCLESDCAWWVAGEYQVCSIKHSASFIRLMNNKSIDIIKAIDNLTKYGG